MSQILVLMRSFTSKLINYIELFIGFLQEKFAPFFTMFFVLVFSINIIGQNNSSPKGKEFWVAYMENLQLGLNGPPFFSLWIHSDVNTSGTVQVFSSTKLINFKVEAGKTCIVKLPNTILYPEGSNSKKKCGIKITANDAIDVVGLHNRAYFSESSRIFPKEQIGTNYIVLANNGNPGVSSFAICATENNTEVEISPSAETTDGKFADEKFTVTLNEGEVYQLQSNFNLSGSRVISKTNKKIAVFGGAKTAYVNVPGCSFSSADSHLWEQNPSTDYFDKKFVLAPIMNHGPMPITIVSKDNKRMTLVINGKVIQKDTIFNTIISTPTIIESDVPIAIAFFMKSLGCNNDTLNRGDPSMFIASPFKNTDKKYTFSTLTGLVGSNNSLNPECFVQVFVPTKFKNTLKLDGDFVRQSRLKAIPNLPEYLYCDLQLDSGTHVLQCDSGIQGYVMGAGSYDAFSYSLNGPGEIKKENPISGDYDIFSIDVFPVPVSNTNLKVRFNIPPANADQFTIINARFELYDEIGKLIAKKSQTVTRFNNIVSFNSFNLAPAIYYLRIAFNQQKFVYKVMKL